MKPTADVPRGTFLPYRCWLCGQPHGWHGQSYCHRCHAAYARDWRRRRAEREAADVAGERSDGARR